MKIRPIFVLGMLACKTGSAEHGLAVIPVNHTADANTVDAAQTTSESPTTRGHLLVSLLRSHNLRLADDPIIPELCENSRARVIRVRANAVDSTAPSLCRTDGTADPGDYQLLIDSESVSFSIRAQSCLWNVRSQSRLFRDQWVAVTTRDGESTGVLRWFDEAGNVTDSHQLSADTLNHDVRVLTNLHLATNTGDELLVTERAGSGLTMRWYEHQPNASIQLRAEFSTRGFVGNPLAFPFLTENSVRFEQNLLLYFANPQVANTSNSLMVRAPHNELIVEDRRLSLRHQYDAPHPSVRLFAHDTASSGWALGQWLANDAQGIVQLVSVSSTGVFSVDAELRPPVPDAFNCGSNVQSWPVSSRQSRLAYTCLSSTHQGRHYIVFGSIIDERYQFEAVVPLDIDGRIVELVPFPGACGDTTPSLIAAVRSNPNPRRGQGVEETSSQLWLVDTHSAPVVLARQSIGQWEALHHVIQLRADGSEQLVWIKYSDQSSTLTAYAPVLGHPRHSLRQTWQRRYPFAIDSIGNSEGL